MLFNHQPTYSDIAEREKLKLLHSLNLQIETMAIKLDQIVSHVEEVHFKIPQSNKQNSMFNVNDLNKNNNINNLIILPGTNFESQKFNNNTEHFIKDSNNSATHILITINDVNPLSDLQPMSTIQIKSEQNLPIKKNKRIKLNPNLILNKTQSYVVPFSREYKAPDGTAKRNKQQRQFNTFVRESINQLLGPDFMRTHDVQDIDGNVMEMIRKEAVENYLPENIRPRRAWHLAKASLRTLKRTLNNRK